MTDELERLHRENALLREELGAQKNGATIALLEDTAAIGIELERTRRERDEALAEIARLKQIILDIQTETGKIDND